MRPVCDLIERFGTLRLEDATPAVCTQFFTRLLSELQRDDFLVDEIGIQRFLIPEFVKILPLLTSEQLFACLIALGALYHQKDKSCYMKPLIDMLFYLGPLLYQQRLAGSLYNGLLEQIEWLEEAKILFQSNSTRSHLISHCIDVFQNRLAQSRLTGTAHINTIELSFLLAVHIGQLLQTDREDKKRIYFYSRGACPDISIDQLMCAAPLFAIALGTVPSATCFDDLLQLDTVKEIAIDTLSIKSHDCLYALQRVVCGFTIVNKLWLSDHLDFLGASLLLHYIATRRIDLKTQVALLPHVMRAIHTPPILRSRIVQQICTSLHGIKLSSSFILVLIDLFEQFIKEENSPEFNANCLACIESFSLH